MANGPDADVQHEVLRGLAAVGDGLGVVDAASCWSLSDGQARAALGEATRLLSVVRSAYLRLLAESARRDVSGQARAGGDGVVRPAAETTAWLAAEHRMGVGRVRADLREAKALDAEDGELRRLGSELATGAITPEHAAIGVKALAQVPKQVRAERRADIDARLTKDALAFAPPTTRVLAQHLLAAVDPGRGERFDAEADQRRELYMATDSTGMLIIRGQLGPAGGATVKGMLDHLSAPHRPAVVETGPGQGGPGQTEIGIRDVRTPAQRRADGLVEMARLASGNVDVGVRAGEPPRVVVHTTPEQIATARRDGGAAFLRAPGAASCEQTGPISPLTLARLACDAIIDRVVLDGGGRVLEMQSLGRLFTAAQRRALAARDGGCAWPGCDWPPSWTDAHHVIFWTDGGPTTVENGVLLCESHHTTVHVGEWLIVMRDGLPWFVPPLRIDPLRRPLRNTVHDAIAENRRTGQQLHLCVDIEPERPPDTS